MRCALLFLFPLFLLFLYSDSKSSTLSSYTYSKEPRFPSISPRWTDLQRPKVVNLPSPRPRLGAQAVTASGAHPRSSDPSSFHQNGSPPILGFPFYCIVPGPQSSRIAHYMTTVTPPPTTSSLLTFPSMGIQSSGSNWYSEHDHLLQLILPYTYTLTRGYCEPFPLYIIVRTPDLPRMSGSWPWTLLRTPPPHSSPDLLADLKRYQTWPSHMIHPPGGHIPPWQPSRTASKSSRRLVMEALVVLPSHAYGPPVLTSLAEALWYGIARLLVYCAFTDSLVRLRSKRWRRHLVPWVHV